MSCCCVYYKLDKLSDTIWVQDIYQIQVGLYGMKNLTHPL